MMPNYFEMVTVKMRPFVLNSYLKPIIFASMRFITQFAVDVMERQKMILATSVDDQTCLLLTKKQ